MFHLIAGLILVVIGFVMTIYKEIKSPKSFPYHAIIFMFAFWGMIGVLIYVERNAKYNTKQHTFNIEIRQEIVNDQVIKSDTIYIIKKK